MSYYPAAPGLARVASRLRNRWGIDSIEVPGWETRGSGPMIPKAMVRHHTASPPGSSRTASLRTVTFGRADLRNALCTWYSPRTGRELYLVAAGTAWHAGKGGWFGLVGNGSVAGLEAENDGVGERWSDDAIYCARALEVEMAREFDWQIGATGCEHYEWATGRKVDRRGIDGGAERVRVAEVLTAPHLDVTGEDPDVIRLEQRDPDGAGAGPVHQLQHLLSRLIYATGGGFDGGGMQHGRGGRHLSVDGHFGAKTHQAVAVAINRAEKVLGHPLYADAGAITAATLAFLVDATERALHPPPAAAAIDGVLLIEKGRLEVRRAPS